MPSWALEAAGTFAISAVSAYIFLRLRCRGIGYPFGPRARWWAILVVLITAIIATGLGVAIAVTDRMRAVYVAVLVPSGLWLGKWSSANSSRRRTKLMRVLLAEVAAPLRRLDDSMGEDLHDWCDARSAPAGTSLKLVGDAAEHYYTQMASRVKDPQKRHDLDSRIGSIHHKVAMARMARRATVSAAVLRDCLRDHPSTGDTRKYNTDDRITLARRLESDAANEFHLLLAAIYRLGFRKMIAYRGFKPMPQIQRSNAPAVTPTS